jgi:hypothetical protein
VVRGLRCKLWAATAVESSRLMFISPETVPGKHKYRLHCFAFQRLTSCRFIKGHCLLIGIIGMAFFLTLFMTTWTRMENSRRDKVAGERGPVSLTEEQRIKDIELADNASWFRYTV